MAMRSVVAAIFDSDHHPTVIAGSSINIGREAEGRQWQPLRDRGTLPG